MYDFDIDPTNGDLVVLQAGSILDRYTYDGNYKSSVRVPFAFQEFLLTDTGYIFYQDFSVINQHLGAQSQKGLLITDKDFRLKETACHVKPTRWGKLGKDLFRVGDRVLVTRAFTDTIYSIDKNGISASVRIDYESNKLNPELLYNQKHPGKIVRANSDKCRFSGDYSETEMHRCIMLDTNDWIILYQDKESGNIQGGTRIFAETGVTPIVIFPNWCTKEYFVACINISKEKPLCTKIVAKEDSIKASKLTEESNPTLVFYKMKHF